MGTQRYQVFSDVDWLYPDTEITHPANSAILHTARGADVCFQVITDSQIRGDEPFSAEMAGLPVTLQLYQLAPMYVSLNSGPKLHTTADYEQVKDFVTRKAPFSVYDATFELDGTLQKPGRAAFYIRLNVPSDATVGEHSGSVTLHFGEESVAVPVTLTVYNTVVPPLETAAFHMVNWIYYDSIAEKHGMKPFSEEYLQLLDRYMDNQLDMRNDFLMIPSGEVIRDADGTVVDFDFTRAEIVGNMALKRGFRYIMGGFIARWLMWDKEGIYLLWDKEVNTASLEGYRQIKLYFKRAYECVCRNGWGEQYMQCIVDEPQFPSAMAYRALSGICRQNMPGIKINDPVETTDIEGAVDIWVVKQAIYEKYLEDFRKIQSYGDEMWLYTCGFPAGKTMNRVMDLPLTVSRLPMWLCFKYDCPGFLHWGYHCTAAPDENGIIDGCLPKATNPNVKYPPGNGHVVYPLGDRPVYSVRGHAQRTGAIDYELLHMLAQKDRAAALAIVDSVCTSFDEYDPSPEAFNAAREALLRTLG